LKIVRFLVAVFFVVGIVLSVSSSPSMAFPPFLPKAKKFGARDCTFCHVKKTGGEPFNMRGKWLVSEKEKRNADTVDPEWLADYKAGKKGK
jgi:hypothetical protein